MKLTSYAGGGDFISAAGDILRSDEARYGLVYGIARATAENPHHYGEENPWFCTISDENGINAMAWRTPPYQPGLVWVGGDAQSQVSLLLDEVRSRWPVIPGVMGDRDIVEPFVREWCRSQGASVLHVMEQRLYRLDNVSNISPASGGIRCVTMDDIDLAEKWMHGFMVDCFGVSVVNRPHQDITPVVKKGDLFLWEYDGVPVSMCARTRPTDTSITISYVYTPPEQRGKGYASSCVAAVCREILSSGKKMCSLYADLSNPFSNAAYVKVGFYPVCDTIDYTFTATE